MFTRICFKFHIIAFKLSARGDEPKPLIKLFGREVAEISLEAYKNVIAAVTNPTDWNAVKKAGHSITKLILGEAFGDPSFCMSKLNSGLIPINPTF